MVHSMLYEFHFNFKKKSVELGDELELEEQKTG